MPQVLLASALRSAPLAVLQPAAVVVDSQAVVAGRGEAYACSAAASPSITEAIGMLLSVLSNDGCWANAAFTKSNGQNWKKWGLGLLCLSVGGDAAGLCVFWLEAPRV